MKPSFPFNPAIILTIAQISFSVCEKNNVLLIIVDDLRASLRCYGDLQAYTPNIDSLAQRSVIFTRAYAQQALCGPSRTSLLTSRSPHHLHQYDVHQYWRSSVGNFTSLPQYFRENGYHTMSVGKVFHPGKCSNFVDDQPFSWSQQPFHPSTERYKNYPVCPDVGRMGPSRSVVCPVNIRSQPERTLPDLQSLQVAENYLLKHTKTNFGQPFFLAVGFQKPHIPLKFPKKYLRYHPLCNISLPSMRSKPPNLPRSAWNPWVDVRQRDDIRSLNISFPWGEMPDDWARRVKQSYYASVSYVDDLVGQLVRKLDELGQRNNTIVLLTSDHGWSIGEHGLWSKYSNYDVATRVPFILSIPGQRGRKIKHLVELLDIFPTLADLAGLKAVPGCENGYSQICCTDGKSLRQLINENKEKKVKQVHHVPLLKWRDGAFSQYPRPGVEPSEFPNSDQPHLKDIKIMGYSIRTSQHRYTEWVQFDTKVMAPNWKNVFGTELYDHDIDPHENLNLSDREDLLPLTISLREKLHLRWNF